MNMYLRNTILLFLILFGSLPAVSHNTYPYFDNITLTPEASVVSCFVQDPQGVIWIGSDKGLFSYDGYATHRHFDFEQPQNNRINCGVALDDGRIYLGADNGVHIYNSLTDGYEPTDVQFPTDVRALLHTSAALWIGSLNGLYIYSLGSKTLQHYSPQNTPGLCHETIYALAQTPDGHIYIGTYNGFCCYSPHTGRFETIALPSRHAGGRNQFINSLLHDAARQCIWIGTEGQLFQYFPATGQSRVIEGIGNNSVKSLVLDESGQLLAGTDNGLYVYRPDAPLLHIRHDSRNGRSLTNNIVWSIFRDRHHNIWLGTDHGISLARYNSAFSYMPIDRITGSGDGNYFYALYKDSKGRFWMGGTDGLIRRDAPGAPVDWYRMGDRRRALPHNRVRHIYEDRDNRLWIATDGGLNRYDPAWRRFVRYNITDAGGRYNSNWAYCIHEDGRGRLWVATCLGGVFMVDKKKLLASGGWNYVADHNFNTSNGLSGMFVNQLVPDADENIWVVLYNKRVDKINTRTLEVTPVQVEDMTGGKPLSYIINAADGRLWGGFRGGIAVFDTRGEACQTIPFENSANAEVLAMAEVNERIWVSTTEGVWIADARTLSMHRLNLMQGTFPGIYYDAGEDKVYLGGMDGVAVVSTQAPLDSTRMNPIFITSLLINNEAPTHIHTLTGGQSIRTAHALRMRHNENNLLLEVSDLPYSLDEKNRFTYFLTDVDSRWHTLPSGSNRISYSNLPYGDYTLQISRADASGRPMMEHLKTISICIAPPWYLTSAAKLLYFMLVVGLILWTIHFFGIKHRLKLERVEKKRMQNEISVISMASVIEGTSPEEQFLAQVNRAIEECMADSDFNVNALADRLNTNTKQLYRRIKQLTGKSPVDYIKSLRMKRAARLLKQKNYTVAEVMYKVGYSNHSYFARSFKGIFGKTPKEYMEEGVGEKKKEEEG